MKYTITENTERRSLEIKFEAKPDARTREALKSLRFRWHRQRGIWYGYTDRQTLEQALTGAPVAEAPAAEAPAALRLLSRDEIRAAFATYWNGRMTDYCTKKAELMVSLPGGELLPIDKQSIRKDFCFGESGYDYDDALQAAEHARTSEDHFRAENMREFNEWISALEAARTLDQVLVIRPKPYMNQTDACRIAAVSVERLTDVLDACGGSAYLEELPGKALTIRGEECRVATAEELEIILAAYRQAAAKHEKKVNAYLTRYGTSKVHAWTYWRDA